MATIKPTVENDSRVLSEPCLGEESRLSLGQIHFQYVEQIKCERYQRRSSGSRGTCELRASRPSRHQGRSVEESGSGDSMPKKLVRSRTLGREKPVAVVGLGRGHDAPNQFAWGSAQLERIGGDINSKRASRPAPSAGSDVLVERLRSSAGAISAAHEDGEGLLYSAG